MAKKPVKKNISLRADEQDLKAMDTIEKYIQSRRKELDPENVLFYELFVSRSDVLRYALRRCAKRTHAIYQNKLLVNTCRRLADEIYDNLNKDVDKRGKLNELRVALADLASLHEK